MFHLSVVDHIRLSFGTVVGAYQAHADAAAALARWGWRMKLAMLAFIGVAAVASLVALQQGRAFQIAAAVATAAGFVACAIYAALDSEPRVYGHRASAARLWLLSERYRALLADIHDEALDLPMLMKRRDALLQEASAVFEQAPPGDRHTFEIAKRALSGGSKVGYSDRDVDEFLPPSLRRAKDAPAA
jgi:conflict system pore-forming effector with SLATT domain